MPIVVFDCYCYIGVSNLRAQRSRPERFSAAYCSRKSGPNFAPEERSSYGWIFFRINRRSVLSQNLNRPHKSLKKPNEKPARSHLEPDIMKTIQSIALPLGLLVLLAPCVNGGSVANPQSCLNSVNQGVDYFEYKVAPLLSQKWTIEYADTYKIVRNLAANETYLLYLCGTQPPANNSYTAVAEIPLTEVGIMDTTMIPFLELLGLRTRIAAVLFSAQYISSPCLRDLVDSGKVQQVLEPSNVSSFNEVPQSLPVFIENYGDVVFKNRFRISASEETTNLAIFEWIKFYAAFFNEEESANEIFNKTDARYNCVEKNAQILESDKNKTVVLWGAYSAYCGGWDVARCPEYYCELANDCSAKILSSYEGSINSTLCGRNYMTTQEFVAFGKNADVWIYTSFDINDVLANYSSDLKEFVSVQNKAVYDYQGEGSSAWFEERLAEPGKSFHI